MQVKLENTSTKWGYNAYMSNFPKNLERRMKMQGDDVAKISRIANVSLTAVYDWLSGKTDIRPNKLKLLADHYKTTPIDLYHGGDAINTAVLFQASEALTRICKDNDITLTERQKIAATALIYKKIINEGGAEDTFILDVLSVAG